MIFIRLFILLCSISIANAVDVPATSIYDGRIQNINYNEGDVVSIFAQEGLSLRIVFSNDEMVEDIASGFSSGWELIDKKNILYVKPKSVKQRNGQEEVVLSPTPKEWNTNLMVRTSKRLYDFDLHLLPKNTSKQVAYRVEFKYPEDIQKALVLAQAKIESSMKQDEKNPPRNWSYSMQVGDGSQNIKPSMAYDDGIFTYLTFPANQDMPSVFLVAEDKTESLVNKHVDKDQLVIHRIAREFVLRLGNSVVNIINDNFDTEGVPTDSGTSIPNLKRIVKEGN